MREKETREGRKRERERESQCVRVPVFGKKWDPNQRAIEINDIDSSVDPT